MFRSNWTILRERMLSLANATILWNWSVKIHRYMICGVVATSISGCGVCSVCCVVWDCCVYCVQCSVHTTQHTVHTAVAHYTAHCTHSSPTLHSTHYTQQSHTTHTTAWNTCCHNTANHITMYFYSSIPQYCGFSKAQHKLPEDGPKGAKHVGANIEIF
jgi:hypothetical protein